MREIKLDYAEMGLLREGLTLLRQDYLAMANMRRTGEPNHMVSVLDQAAEIVVNLSKNIETCESITILTKAD